MNRVFDFEDKRLWNSNPKICIRVRTEGENTIVTYWSKIESDSFVKKRGHHEFISDNLEETINLLKKIGMKRIFPKKSKDIERYEKGGIIFEFNIFPERVDFEIEGESKEKIEEGLELVGLSVEDIKNND